MASKQPPAQRIVPSVDDEDDDDDEEDHPAVTIKQSLTDELVENVRSELTKNESSDLQQHLVEFQKNVKTIVDNFNEDTNGDIEKMKDNWKTVTQKISIEANKLQKKIHSPKTQTVIKKSVQDFSVKALDTIEKSAKYLRGKIKKPKE